MGDLFSEGVLLVIRLWTELGKEVRKHVIEAPGLWGLGVGGGMTDGVAGGMTESIPAHRSVRALII